MIGLELAKFLAVCLGLFSGWIIFQCLKSYRAHSNKSLKLLIPLLFLSLLGSVLLQSYREPIVKKISYQLSQEEFDAISPAQTKAKRMRVRLSQPFLDGPILLRPVYKQHFLGTVCLVAILLIGNRNKFGQNKPKVAPREKPTHKPLPNLDKGDVLARLNDLMQHQKLYNNPMLSLDELSSALDISKYHFSQLINQELGKNFYELINDYRVEEAKELMNDPNYDHFTLSSLGLEVGFNSKASFYRAFKRKTGTTPAFYKKQLKR